MAIPAGQIWECNTSATASNANAGGFDPTNAGMLTDATATSATGNSPVVSSASYNFVAGDVGHWLYIKAGTNWTPGFYQIASVAANAATLTATIGTADQAGYGAWTPSTVAGCATTASPTGGTFTIDYSRSTAAPFSTTVLTSTASTTVTDVTGAFTPVMVGNTVNLTAGAGITAGRYSIATYISATSLTFDRASGTYTAGVSKIGGALSLGTAVDDAIFELAIAGNIWYVKNGTYTESGAISIAAVGTLTAHIQVLGYASQRGDNPTGSTRPTFNCAANGFAFAANYWDLKWLIVTGTSSAGASCPLLSVIQGCKLINSSATASRNALTIGSGSTVVGCEAISYRGVAFGVSAAASGLFGCWGHDSDKGISNGNTSNTSFAINCIWSAMVTVCVDQTSTQTHAGGNFNSTFFGTTSKRGIGLRMSATEQGAYPTINCTFSGFTTGVTQTTAFTNSFSDYNNFYNNTTDRTNWTIGQHDVAVDPAFTSVTERTGSTATTTAGNHLVQAGATFQTWAITTNDFVYISGGTGVTAGVYGIASIDSETQITADITLSANATGDKVWWIVQGNNFLPTGAI